MPIRIVVEPPVEPVTRDELKAAAKVDLDFTDQDAYLDAIIVALRQYAENYMRRKIVLQTLELSRKMFKRTMELPGGELQSVVSVKYTDFSGIVQTVDPSIYQIDTITKPGQIQPNYAMFWPADVRTTEFNAVKIQYVVGFAAAGSPLDYAVNVPEAIKRWICVRGTDMYENRSSFVKGTIVTPIPRTIVDGLLDRYRISMFPTCDEDDSGLFPY